MENVKVYLKCKACATECMEITFQQLQWLVKHAFAEHLSDVFDIVLKYQTEIEGDISELIAMSRWLENEGEEYTIDCDH